MFDHHYCPDVVAMRTALETLSTAVDDDLIARQLTHLSVLLQRHPPKSSDRLDVTSRWLVAKLEALRDLVMARRSPRLVHVVNDLAHELLLALDDNTRRWHPQPPPCSISGDLDMDATTPGLAITIPGVGPSDRALERGPRHARR
ncbi:hypothetical protein [Actinophytocola gossypii]|uniref:Uncharacterized protein n=1 Tax=Actinophytocola gossypii TaxID=2812003 RepID=A0ABT2J9Z0_9PSEU|nr:hypothetical protein [Actinophytocola gossypii]MCT2584583.1 hypothetical protein [Actinophytocola gossypii]